MAVNKKPKRSKKNKPYVGETPKRQVAIRALPQKLNETEMRLLSEEPHRALGRAMLGSLSINDWYTLSFRIGVGLGIARMAYSDEVIQPFEDAKLGLNLLIDRQAQKVKLPGLELCQLFTTCLDAVDEMQKEITRETQIFVSRKVRYELKKLALEKWPGGPGNA